MSAASDFFAIIHNPAAECNVKNGEIVAGHCAVEIHNDLEILYILLVAAFGHKEFKNSHSKKTVEEMRFTSKNSYFCTNLIFTIFKK